MSTETYVWAFLKKDDQHTCGYIENKKNLKVGSLVEMLDYNGEMWEVTQLGEVVSREFVMGQQRRGKDFAHSLR